MTLLDAAQNYFDEGFNPLPLKNNKAPMLNPGHPFLYEKIDRIEERFTRCEKIGIACGDISDGFYCIDFDCHKGEDIESVFVEFFDNPAIQHLINSDLMTAFKTPSGGFHLYFKYKAQIKGTVYAKYRDGSTMIEQRGHGQYIAVYPSEGYDYIAGGEIIKLDYIDIDTLSWVVELAKSFDVLPEVSSAQLNGSGKLWPDKWDDSKYDGNFNNTQGDYVKTLLIEAGWKLITTRRNDGVELWQRPGKEIVHPYKAQCLAC